MTTESQADEVNRTDQVPVPSTLSDVPAGKSFPRIWTVFVAYLAAFAASLFVQIMGVIGLAVWHVTHGGSFSRLQDDLQELVSTPGALIALAMMSQLVILFAAIIPARLSTEPARRRLGLVAPAMPTWGYLTIAIGGLVPLALGVALAVALAQIIKPDPSVRLLYEHMTWEWAVPFVLFISLVPGFVEETFFRGYMQRRLLERWSPAVAILVTTFLFALMHVTPHAVVNAFVIGLWLGALAWRTGSVWPGVVSHASINGLWNIWQIGKVLGIFAAVPSLAVTATICTVALACFLASIWLLVQPRIDTTSPAIA
jgi:uncharacterized protein